MQKLIEAVSEILSREHLDLHDDDRAMLLAAMPSQAPDDLRAEAENLHGSDEIEIDDAAYMSQADDGTWVSAWVWVPATDDACDNCGETAQDGSGTCITCGQDFSQDDAA